MTDFGQTSQLPARPKSRIARLFTCSFAVLACLAAAPAPGLSQKTVDAILVLVNNEPVLRSDVIWDLALDPTAPDPAGQISSDLLKQKLDVLIDRRLTAQEAARIPSAEITNDEMDRERQRLIAQFPSEAAFRRRVESVGLTPDRLDDFLRQRILINRFIDFRFRSFVFVSEEEIKKYYDEVLAPKVREAGQVPPPLEQVRSGIVDTLREEKVYEEIDRFLVTIRQRAEIVTLSEP
jgi:hypothetical protein